MLPLSAITSVPSGTVELSPVPALKTAHPLAPEPPTGSACDAAGATHAPAKPHAAIAPTTPARILLFNIPVPFVSNRRRPCDRHSDKSAQRARKYIAAAGARAARGRRAGPTWFVARGSLWGLSARTQ
jgi:hypothetical protein